MSIVKQSVLLPFLLAGLGQVAIADSSIELASGTWPSEIKKIEGSDTKQKRLILKATDSTPYRLRPGTIKIQIDSETVVYVPDQAKISARPTVYRHPELSEEVRKFYSQGVGNYAFWAFLIGVAAAVQ